MEKIKNAYKIASEHRACKITEMLETQNRKIAPSGAAALDRNIGYTGLATITKKRLEKGILVAGLRRDFPFRASALTGGNK